MTRSFGLVENKLHEADFFLDRLSAAQDLFEARYFFSAFASAARSVTFVLQACMSDVPGFSDWYEGRRTALRSDPTSRFFHRVRNESQKIGTNPVCGGTFARTGPKFFMLTQDVREGDPVAAARAYMTKLVETIDDCFSRFGSVIDPEQYYTLQNLSTLGLTVEDVEEELGFPRGWTALAAADPHERLFALRRNLPRSTIDEILEKYLGRPREFILNGRSDSA